MLEDKSHVQVAANEIQLLQRAAVKYRHAPVHANTYAGFTDIADLELYLGRNQLGDGVNIFGEDIDVSPRPGDLDLQVEYPGVPSIEVCQQILENFGTVTDNGSDTLVINPNDTLPGYIGGTYTETGCSKPPGSDVYDMAIIID